MSSGYYAAPPDLGDPEWSTIWHDDGDKSLLIAERIGEVVSRFRLTDEEARRIMDKTLAELKEQILERI